MIHFTPTLGIKDTAKNVNGFIKENMDVFWEIFKPLAPYIIVLSIIDVIIIEYFMPVSQKTGMPHQIPIAGIIAGYFYTCLAISWHRVVIHGADNYEPMKPFNPKKSELAFIGMGILLFIGVFMGGFIVALLGTIISPIMVIFIIPFILFATYLWMKFMFYFPAKATGRHISLEKSFVMTKGYIWKMFAGYFVTAFKVMLIMLAYVIASIFVILALDFAITSFGGPQKLTKVILTSLYMIPLVLFFHPMFAIIWVSVLSNYYQYVMQNDGMPPTEEDYSHLTIPEAPKETPMDKGEPWGGRD